MLDLTDFDSMLRLPKHLNDSVEAVKRKLETLQRNHEQLERKTDQDLMDVRHVFVNYDKLERRVDNLTESLQRDVGRLRAFARQTQRKLHILRKEDRQIIQKLTNNDDDDDDDENRNDDDEERDDDDTGRRYHHDGGRRPDYHSSSSSRRGATSSRQLGQAVDRLSSRMDRVVHDVDRLKTVSTQRTSTLEGVDDRLGALKAELRQHSMDSVLFKAEIRKLAVEEEEEQRTLKRLEAEMEVVKRNLKRNRYRIERLAEMGRKRAVEAAGGGGGGERGEEE